MKTSLARENGYLGSLEWCLDCNVGWAMKLYVVGDCWLCGSNENVWSWAWSGKEPTFERRVPA